MQPFKIIQTYFQQIDQKINNHKTIKMQNSTISVIHYRRHSSDEIAHELKEVM